MGRKLEIPDEPTKRRDYTMTDKGDHFMKTRKRRVEVIARHLPVFDKLYSKHFKKLEVELYGNFKEVLDD